MGYRGAAGFALGVAIRAAVIAALAFAGLAAALTRHWYATALILGAVALAVAFDLARSALSVDRALAQFVDGLMAEGYERPAIRPTAGRLAGAVERALDQLGVRRAERQRRLEYLLALLDTVGAAVLVVDGAGAVEFANRAARQRLGEAASLGQFAAFTPDTAAALIAAPLASQQVVTLASGQRLLASIGGFAAGGQRRRLIALQSVSGDLAAVELEAWQGLTRILAHEMMNSLTPICSLAERLPALMPLELGAGDAREAIEVIARRSAGLMSFVDRYRRLADLPAPQASAIPAQSFVAGLETLVAPMLAERGVAFEARCEPPSLVLRADPDLIEQATINLLKNALEAAAGREGARVTLACLATGDEVAIVVADNGPGLAPAAAEEAFTPFFTTKPGGHGIGLTLARQIALAHGGRLEHRPLSPTGAEFRIVLPRA